MAMMYRSRRKPAVALLTATREHSGISRTDRHCLDLGQQYRTERWDEICADNLAISFMRSGRDLSLDIFQPLVEKLREGNPIRLDRRTVPTFRNQSGSFHLGLPFGAGEAMPAPFALTGYRIT